jgi:ankyrin repeat protein
MSLEKVDLNKYVSLYKALALVNLEGSGFCFGFAYTAADQFLNNRLEELALILEQMNNEPAEVLEKRIDEIIEKRNRLVCSKYPEVEETIREKHTDEIKKIVLTEMQEQFNIQMLDEKSFDQDLMKIYQEKFNNTLHLLTPFLEEKLALEKKALSDAERYTLQIKPLLYSIKIHHEGYLLPGLFEDGKKPPAHDAVKTFGLVQSSQSPEDRIVCVKKMIGTYNSGNLEKFFSLLCKVFDQMVLKNHRIALTLHSGSHVFFIGYDNKEKCWTFVDINPLRIMKRPIETDENGGLRDINIDSLHGMKIPVGNEQTLADIINAAFDNTSGHSIFSTHIYIKNTSGLDKVNHEFLQLEENDEWKKLHAVTQLKWLPRNNDGSSLLSIAAIEGLTETVKAILVDPGFEAEDLNKTNKNGFTSFCYAVQNGFLNTVQLLLADPRLDPNISANDKSSPLKLAVQHKHLGIIEALIKDARVDPNLANSYNITPLYVAVYYGCLDAVEILLTHPKIDPNLAYMTGSTPLYLAVHKGEVKIVEALLKNIKTNPNLAIYEPPNIGQTPLFLAMSLKMSDDNLMIIKKLIDDERLDPNLKYNDETYLHWAVNAGETKIVEALLKNSKTNLNLATNGETPIIVAAKKGELKIVDMLLADSRVDPKDRSTVIEMLFKDNSTHFSPCSKLTFFQITSPTQQAVLSSASTVMANSKSF